MLAGAAATWCPHRHCARARGAAVHALVPRCSPPTATGSRHRRDTCPWTCPTPSRRRRLRRGAAGVGAQRLRAVTFTGRAAARRCRTAVVPRFLASTLPPFTRTTPGEEPQPRSPAQFIARATRADPGHLDPQRSFMDARRRVRDIQPRSACALRIVPTSRSTSPQDDVSAYVPPWRSAITPRIPASPVDTSAPRHRRAMSG